MRFDRGWRLSFFEGMMSVQCISKLSPAGVSLKLSSKLDDFWKNMWWLGHHEHNHPSARRWLRCVALKLVAHSPYGSSASQLQLIITDPGNPLSTNSLAMLGFAANRTSWSCQDCFCFTCRLLKIAAWLIQKIKHLSKTLIFWVETVGSSSGSCMMLHVIAPFAVELNGFHSASMW